MEDGVLTVSFAQRPPLHYETRRNRLSFDAGLGSPGAAHGMSSASEFVCQEDEKGLRSGWIRVESDRASHLSAFQFD